MKPKPVTQYCQTLWCFLRNPPHQTADSDVSAKQPLGYVVSGNGWLFQFVDVRGLTAIVNDNGQRYVPVNLSDFTHVVHGHCRVNFTLRVFPEIPNTSGKGVTAMIQEISPL